MNRLHVRSLTVGITIMLVGFAAFFGWRAATTEPDRPAPGAASGAELFQIYCAGCHTPEELARRLRAAPDPAARRREFEAMMLGSHGEAPEADDRRILEYLTTLRH